MNEYIDKQLAISHPFANGQYDHKNANADFILGHECYKEWLENLPSIDTVPWSALERYADYFSGDATYPEFVRMARAFLRHPVTDSAEGEKQMPEIKINYQFLDNKPVSKKGGWYDIPLPHDLYYDVGDIVKITFDLRVEMPRGYEAIIVPRSSTLEKTGLISSGFGVIEDSYCGPDDFIGYRFYATKGGYVPAGSCLVQMRFQEKMGDYKLKRVNNEYFQKNINRGGFGSTDGIKEVEPDEEDHYAKGHSDGFEEGFQEGYEDGFNKGYDQATLDIRMDKEKEYSTGYKNGISMALREAVTRIREIQQAVE